MTKRKEKSGRIEEGVSPSPSSQRLEQAILALLVGDRKIEGHQNYVLFTGADPKRSLYCLPDFKFN